MKNNDNNQHAFIHMHTLKKLITEIHYSFSFFSIPVSLGKNDALHIHLIARISSNIILRTFVKKHNK